MKKKLLFAKIFYFFAVVVIAGCKADIPEEKPKNVEIWYYDEEGNDIYVQPVTLYPQYNYEEIFYPSISNLNSIKTGYKVSKYTDKNGNEIIPNVTKIKENISIIVSYELISYTIRFEKTTGVEGDLPEEIICVYDQEVTLPKNNLTNENKRPDGWSTNNYSTTKTIYNSEQVVKNLCDKDNSIITLYANFRDTELKINFYDSLDDIFPNSVYIDKNESFIDKIPEYSSDYYLFDGWYLKSDLTKTIIDIENYIINENDIDSNGTISFVRALTKNDFTLKFTIDGNYHKNIYSKKVGDSIKDILPIEPTKNYFIFKGWYLKSDESKTIVDFNTYTIKKEDSDNENTITFEPFFERESYKVNFILGDEFGENVLKTIKVNEKIKDNLPFLNGYTLNGYYLKNDPTQSLIDLDSFVFSEDYVDESGYIEICCLKTENTLTIKFSTEHGTAPSNISKSYNQLDIIKTLFTTVDFNSSINGYNFLGWYDKDNKSYESINVSVLDNSSLQNLIKNESVTLYLTAKWEIWKGTTRFNYLTSYDSAEYVYDEEDTAIVEYSQTYKLPKYTKPNISGLTFLGWALEPHQITPYYTDEGEAQVFMNSNNEIINLYAVYQKAPIGVSIDVTPSENPTDLVMEYNKSLNVLYATLEGAKIYKWYVDGVLVENTISNYMSVYDLKDGYQLVTVTAEKDGILYSATIHIGINRKGY